MNIDRRLCVLLTLLLAFLSQSAVAGDWKTTEEHWYELLIGDAKAGWMSIVLEDDGQRLRLSVESNLKLERASQSVEVTTKAMSLETRRGDPVEFTFDQKSSSQPVQRVWRFEPEKVVQTTRQGGRETIKDLPLPGAESGKTWLMPAAADAFVRQRREAGAEEIRYSTIDPEHGLEPVETVSKRAGETTYQLGGQGDGRTIPVTIWKTISEAFPIEATEYVSSDGHLVYQEIDTGIGKMVTRIVPREQAKLGGGVAPELMVGTFVKPDRPLPRVMKLRQASLRVKSRRGELPELPSAAAQRVERDENGAVALLRIDMDDNLPAEEGDAENEDFLGSSAMINTDDAFVGKLATSAVRVGSQDDWSRADAMRKRVNRHISRKGMQTAFASAAETAITRQGDCSEHAVLLCAMLRSQKIPARVASGLVYVDQFAGERDVFGWHMWTQALIDGRWHDLDATLPVTYHAGHVLTGTSSLADHDGMSDMASMIMMIGNLDIEVVELGSDGATP